MPISTLTSRNRLILVVLLTLMPWPAVWLGMYGGRSLVLTFILYHGLCLLPAVVAGHRLWRGALLVPTRRQILHLGIAAAFVLPLTVFVFNWIGSTFISSDQALAIVTARGFHARWLVPLGVYFTFVNSILEELFWRGVVLNELQDLPEAHKRAGALWTACTFASWHWLVVRLLVRPGWAELVVAGIVIAGVYFSWLYRRTGSIVLPILWHALIFDLPLILIFAAIVRG